MSPNRFRWNLLLAALSIPLALAGCADEPPSPEPPADGGAGKAASAHDHPDEGPHGGPLIELGDGEYHAELLHDDETGRVTIHLLDESAKKPVAVEAPHVVINLRHDGKGLQFQLAAVPEERDGAGKSSRFVSTEAELGEHLDREDSEPRLVVKFPDKTYNARIPHGHDRDGGAHPHSHAGDDALVWRKTESAPGGYEIRLGHHGKELHAGHEVEPAVGITRDGKPVANAKVFNALLASDFSTVLAEESATVYEPATEDEPAHYAQGTLKIPADVDRVVLSYRIALPDGPADGLAFTIPIEVTR
ncbi:MAG: hypothetical protein KY476_02190 [Planctomycetes bacterium]|nr:hypothetical protein [Planctomycetota bacterium]